MASQELAESFRGQGIKTDLWLTADKEVLPLISLKTGQYNERR